MQKTTGKFNIIIVAVLFTIALLFSAQFAYADNATIINSTNYELVFPNTDSYINLNSPTHITSGSDGLYIYDDSIKTIFHHNTAIKRDINISTSLTSIKDNKDYIFLAEQSGKINIYKKDGNCLTDKFTEFLNSKGLEYNIKNEFINDYAVTDDKIYLVYKTDLYCINITNDFESSSILSKETGNSTLLFNSSNLTIINEDIYFVSATKKLCKLSNGEIAQTDFDVPENAVLSSEYVILYNSSELKIYDYNAKLICEYSKDNLNVKGINSISLDNNHLFVLDTASKNVKQFDIDKLIKNTLTDIECSDIFGSNGNTTNKLDTPISAKFYNGKLYILDSQNKAIKIIENNTVKSINLGFVPTAFEVTNEEIIYTDGNDLVIYNLATTATQTIELLGINDIKSFNNTLLVTTEDKTYQLTKNANNYVVSGTNNANLGKIGCYPTSNFIYYYNQSTNTINKYITANRTISDITLRDTKIDIGELGDIIDYDVDRNGNIVVLSKKDNYKVSFIANNRLHYEVISSIDLVNEDFKLINPTDISIGYAKNNASELGVYITDSNAHFVAKITDTDFTNLIQKDNYYRHNLPTKVALKYEMKVYKTTADTMLYTYHNNYEIADVIPSGQFVWEFDKNDCENAGENDFSDKKMVFCGDEIGYIYDTANLQKVEKTILNKNAKTFSRTNLYQYPTANNDIICATLPVDTKLAIISEVNGYFNKFSWYEVEYENNRYYVVKNDLTEDNGNANKPVDTLYMKTKSSKIGEKIKVYLSNDTASEVILTLIDGERVQVVKKTDNGFTMIKYGDTIGYVLNENLIPYGLTTNQIVAIVVSVIILVVAIIIFVYTMLLRKNRKHKLENK